MKKSLIALAAMAAAGVASAQSSVTLFGIVDATVQRVVNSGGANVTRLHNSGYNSSRLGFRGTEDLGGGMAASFWLEAAAATDDGSGTVTGTNNQGATTGGGGLTFNRRSTVSLSGGFGEIRLGRDYLPQFWNITVFDAFGTNGVGASVIPGGAVRASNSIGYFLPANLGGIYGQVQISRGENAAPGVTKDNGNGYGFRVGFASGPFDVAFGYGKTNFNTGDVKQMNLGGSWNFGVAKVLGYIEHDDAGVIDSRGWNLGALVPVGPGEIRVAVSQYRTEAPGVDPRARKLALGYVHNLSKRTAVYTTIARVSNNGTSATAAAGGAGAPAFGNSSSGLDIGVRHSF
jgi:predicted porin